VRRVAVIALVVAAAASGAVVALRHAGTALVVRDPLPARADAIVVLAGSPADRVLEAADLYAAGLAPRVVLTRERRRPEHEALARRGVVLPESHEVAADALVRLGVPRAAILTLAPRTDSTAAEAGAVAAWACPSGVRRLVVVTSPAHTRRARAIFRRALGGVVDVAVRPAEAAAFPARDWWRHRHAAKIVALEWEKLASHWLVERWGLAPCAPRTLSPRPPS
jgi:uncharacterized SAM-binding protein YcdF (DUF218 family)